MQLDVSGLLVDTFQSSMFLQFSLFVFYLHETFGLFIGARYTSVTVFSLNYQCFRLFITRSYVPLSRTEHRCGVSSHGYENTANWKNQRKGLHVRKIDKMCLFSFPGIFSQLTKMTHCCAVWKMTKKTRQRTEMILHKILMHKDQSNSNKQGASHWLMEGTRFYSNCEDLGECWPLKLPQFVFRMRT